MEPHGINLGRTWNEENHCSFNGSDHSPWALEYYNFLIDEDGEGRER